MVKATQGIYRFTKIAQVDSANPNVPGWSERRDLVRRQLTAFRSSGRATAVAGQIWIMKRSVMSKKIPIEWSTLTILLITNP